jgi:hypothetical protein
MRRLLILLTFLAACTALIGGQTKPAKPLDIYICLVPEFLMIRHILAPRLRRLRRVEAGH